MAVTVFMRRKSEAFACTKREELRFSPLGSPHRLLILPYCLLTLFLFFCVMLAGCASSEVERDVTSNVDMGVSNAKKMAKNVTDSDIAESYQNTPQAVKGAIVGGGLGALTGVLYPSVSWVPFALTGAVLGASYGAYIDANASLKDKLINRGANIIELGDQILIVFPSSRIFREASATIKQDSYSTLNMLSQYINQYNKILVKVSVYTDNTGSARVDTALSDEEAQKLVRYLSENGLNARIIYGVGMGPTRLVSKSKLDWDGNDNYRIEITLEKLYV